MFSSQVNHENEYIYYNANLVNPLSNRSTINCSFEQNFNKELIDDVSLYNMAITRFCLSTQNVPFWICPIALNQPNRNLTPYYIRLHYTDVNGNMTNSDIVNLLYVNTIDPPVSQNNGSSYYFSYDKQDFISMMNVAIQSAMTSLRANYVSQYPSGAYPPPSGAPLIAGIPNADLPVFSYNESLQKFQIYFNANTWLSSNPHAIHFFINDLLYPFLQMPSMNTMADTPDYRLEIAINDNYYTPSYYSTPAYSGLPSGVPFVVMHSDHNTLGLCSPLDKIVLTSQSLQIASESVQPASALFNSLSPSEVNQVVNQQIITDFQPDMTTQNLVNRDFIQFNQSLINSRLIPFLNNKSQLKRLDIAVYWSDKNNNMYPLLLYPNTSFSVKICFKKKNVP